MSRNLRLTVALVCLIVSSLGDDMQAMAIIFKMRAISQDPFLLPLVFSTQLVAGVVAYRLVSTFPEKHGARLVAAISSVALAALALAYTVVESPVQLIAAAAAFSFVSAALNTSLFILVPLAAESFGFDAAKGNALAEGLNSGSAVIGPPLCGLIVVSGNLDFAFVLNAMTFGILIVGLVVLGPVSFQSTKRDAATVPTPTAPKIRWLMVGLAAVTFSTAVSDVVFVLLVETVFGGSALVYGVSTAAWALGLICAAVLAMNRSPLGLMTTFLGAAGMGVGLLLVPLTGSIANLAAVALLTGLFLVGGFFNGLHNISVRTFITSTFEVGQRGRVFGMYGAYCRVGVLSGYWVGSLLATEAVFVAYAVSGAFAVLVGAAGMLFANSNTLGRRKIA